MSNHQNIRRLVRSGPEFRNLAKTCKRNSRNRHPSKAIDAHVKAAVCAAKAPEEVPAEAQIVGRKFGCSFSNRILACHFADVWKLTVCRIYWQSISCFLAGKFCESR